MRRALLLVGLGVFGAAGFRPAHAQQPQVRLAREIEVQITEATRVVMPGGVVVLQFDVDNLEDTAVRVLLRVEAPPGWQPLEPGFERRERPIEAWFDLKGEVLVLAPVDAPMGDRVTLRLVVEVVGEPGSVEALTHVRIARTGRVRPGTAALAGTVSFHASGLNAAGWERGRVSAATDLSGRLGRQTTVSLTSAHGPRENFSNFRYANAEPARLSATLRQPDWTLAVGNQLSSPGNVLVGPYVQGEGVKLRRTQGRLGWEVVLARPTTFLGEAAGHLWRGSLGVRAGTGTVGLAFSDFERPAGGYSTLPPIDDSTLDPDSLAALERQRRHSAASARTRVQGAGVEAELYPHAAHRLLLRAGLLRLSDDVQEEVREPSTQLEYTVSTRSLALGARWQQMPPSLRGVYLAGNERSVDGSVRLVGELRLAARAYRYENPTVGEADRSGTRGGSVGVGYARLRWRMELRGNHRESEFSTRSVRRTGQLSLGGPVGPLALSASGELGREEGHPFRSLRGDLRWNGRAGYGSLCWSHYSTGGLPARQRVDLLTSLRIGEWELAGGAWATAASGVEGDPGVWTSLGIPIGHELLLTLGTDRTLSLGGTEPEWQGRLGIRKKLTLPIPFLRHSSAPP